MSDMGIEPIVDPTEGDVWFVRRNLREYNKQHFETLDHRQLVAFERSTTSETVGGLVFSEFGNWLEIEFLWVHEVHRGKGIGSSLLQFAMDHARDNGLSRAMTETFDFQALPYYRRYGFQVEYEQKGYPVSSSRYFITAEL
jgi:GNAT superfamily N-acetyltransferase